MVIIRDVPGTLVQVLNSFDPFNFSCYGEPRSMADAVMQYFAQEVDFSAYHSTLGDFI
jgi:hypothetical protein